MEKMRTREEILKEMEGVKTDAAREAQFGNPAQLAMQAGINAPLIATALGSLLEVALDIRDKLRNLANAADSLETIEEQVSEQREILDQFFAWACSTGPPGLGVRPEIPEEDVPVIHISNEERIAELLAQGKLKGFEEKCESCGTLMKIIKQDEKHIEWECPKCKRWVTRVIEQESEEVPGQQICAKCGAVLEECLDGSFCPKCDPDPEAQKESGAQWRLLRE